MTLSAHSKIVAAFLVGIVLAGVLSPVAAGMLVCIGDGTEPDCCRNSKDADSSGPAEATQVLAGTDCGCCIAVDALPYVASASSYNCKASFALAVGPAHLRTVVLPSNTRLPRALSDDSDRARLTSLRSVVLLV